MRDLKPMDVYSSDMTVPFEIAAYCRGHKFSPEAVNLARAIQAKAAARKALDEAENALDSAEQQMHACIEKVRANLTIKSA